MYQARLGTSRRGTLAAAQLPSGAVPCATILMPEAMDRRGKIIMRAFVGTVFACLVGAAPVQAQQYPARPITIVVPFGKGTTAEIIGTVVSEAMSRTIGQPVTIELKPGAGGGIAMEQVEKARARRLHAGDDHAGHPRLQSQPLQDAALRPGEDHPDHADRGGRQRHDRAPVESGDHAAGGRGGSQGEARTADLCLGRRRHVASPGRRSVRIDDRCRDQARAASRVDRRREEDRLRRDHHGLLQSPDSDRRDQDRQAQGACGDEPGALVRTCRTCRPSMPAASRATIW